MGERLEKVNATLLSILGTTLRGSWTIPEALATVTTVRVAPDLRTAVVWVSLLPHDTGLWPEVVSKLPELQRAAAHRLQTKHTPKLSLKQDTGGVHAQHIDRLLRESR